MLVNWIIVGLWPIQKKPWGATAVSAIASHVHYLGAYEGVQVTNLIQGTEVCYNSVLEILRSTGYIPSGSIHLFV